MINNIISTITSTFKKLAGGSCWKVILMVAVLVAAAGFVYYKYNKSAEQSEDFEEDDMPDMDEMDEEIEEFDDDEELFDDDDEDFAGIGDMDDEEMKNLGQL